MEKYTKIKDNYQDYHKPYLDYLQGHKKNVKRAYQWMKDNMIDYLRENDGLEIEKTIGNHDLSKFTNEEFDAYAYYFNVSKTEGKDAFDAAWLHHIHNNPHHWQHWVLVKDSGKVFALEIPKHNIFEMVCDWWSFSWTSGNLMEIFDWYEKTKDNIVMHPSSRKFLEEILGEMRKILDEGE